MKKQVLLLILTIALMSRFYGQSIFKDFEDNSLTSGGWSTQNVIGTTTWETNNFGGNYFGRISNYNSTTNSQAEAWFISPSINLSGLSAANLNFDNACNYSGSVLTVYVSTDYDGTSLPSTASWTELNPVLSSGSWAWINSGNLSLAPYLNSSNVYVGFKYTGTNYDGKIWEIDNILIDGSINVSLSEITENIDIQIFPNPTIGKLLLIGQDKTPKNKVEIFNLQGELILEQEDSNEIDLSKIHTGIYIIKIYSGSQVYSKRIVRL